MWYEYGDFDEWIEHEIWEASINDYLERVRVFDVLF